MTDRHCTADNPTVWHRDAVGRLYLDGKLYRGQRTVHEAAAPIPDTVFLTSAEGTIVLMQCPHCGQQFWAEEGPL